MVNPTVAKLLILQDRDQRRLALEAQLKAVPVEVAGVNQKIDAEKAAIEHARLEVRSLESRKKLLETEIGSAEQGLARFRTQQSQVRKNEEFQALGHQIETSQATIGGLEGQELEVMYAIDEARKKFAAAENALQQNIAGHQERLRVLHEREANLREELTGIQAEVVAARAPVEPPGLRVYDRIAARQMPVVVPLHGGKCGGCHLKVSGEVESAARGKVADATPLPTCDQCGRIVYWDA